METFYSIMTIVFLAITGYVWLVEGDMGRAGFYLALAVMNYVLSTKKEN